MTTEEKKTGDVRFEQPPVKLVAERPDDQNIDEENERMKTEHPYPHSCGGA
jgi:hypothetical protein